MGNICSTDVYQQIKDQYPRQFSQYVVGEEVKYSLAQQLGSIKDKVGATANNIQKDNLAIIDTQQNQVKSQFETARQQIDQNYLGGVKSLEQTQGAKVEDILGYTAAQQKFQSLRSEFNSTFNLEKEKVQGELSSIQKQHTDKIASSQPIIPQFDQLPDKLKSEVLQKGAGDYKDLIEAQGRSFLGPLMEKLNPQNFISRFTNLLPLDSLKSLTTLSSSSISQQVQKLIGSPQGATSLFG